MEHAVEMGSLLAGNYAGNFMQTAMTQEPAYVAPSWKVKATRTVEGLAIVVCIIASALLLYFILGPGAEAIVYAVDSVVIVMSGGTAYFAHKTVGGLTVEAQVRRLSRQITILEVETNRIHTENTRYADLNTQLEGNIGTLRQEVARLGAENVRFTESNETLSQEVKRLGAENMRFAALNETLSQEVERGKELNAQLQTEVAALNQEIERISALNAQLEGKVATLGQEVERLGAENGRFAESNTQLGEEIRRLKLASDNFGRAIAAINATGDVEKGIAQLQGELQTQLEEITKKQQRLVEEGERLATLQQNLLRREESLVNRGHAVVQRLENAADQHTCIDKSKDD